MVLIALSVSILVVLLVEPFGAQAQDKVRGCYFTNWAQYRPGRGKFTPENYVSGLCTHIFYAFAGVEPGSFASKASDPTDLGAAGQYAKINGLKKTDKALKTLLSYGGATFGTATFKQIAQSAENRKKFISSAVAFAKANGFDGIDIDWEFPHAEDKATFAALLKDLKAAAGSLIVTAAVSQNPQVIKAGYDASIANSVDFLNVMAYDYHGSWEPSQTGANAPLYDSSPLSVDGAMKAWTELGIPKNKLVMGLATYGRGWTAKGGLGAPASGASRPTEFIREGGIASYYEICEMLSKGGKRTWDDKTKTPYLQSGDQWFTYDDEQSIKEKADYIKANGYRGAFFWTLDNDDFDGKCPKSNGKRYPLIGTVAKVLGGKDIKKRSVRLF
ncbi:CBN-CHT-1 protein [Aphelenchoides avenae]|nr:CBN-CHT-1 protein [Aphelenchus avenae]